MELKQAKQLYLGDVIDSLKNGVAPQDGILLQEVNVKDLESFTNYKVLVDEIKSLYDRTYKGYKDSPIPRLKLYLNHLETMRMAKKNDSFIILKKLIEEFDLANFPPALQEFFKEGIELLEMRIDYFFSYTTRGLPAFNNDYILAIREQYGTKPEMTESWYETNYLAKMIVQFFNVHGFNGFFDETSLVNGDKIKEKVYAYCETSNVFVQFVEQESFTLSEKQTNWCFGEYNVYKKKRNHRYLFYRHPELVRPEGIEGEITDWYEFTSTAEEGVKSNFHIDVNWHKSQIREKVNVDAKIISNERKRLFDDLLKKIE